MEAIATATQTPHPVPSPLRSQVSTGKPTATASKPIEQIAATTRIRGLRTSVLSLASGAASRDSVGGVIGREPTQEIRRQNSGMHHLPSRSTKETGPCHAPPPYSAPNSTWPQFGHDEATAMRPFCCRSSPSFRPLAAKTPSNSVRSRNGITRLLLATEIRRPFADQDWNVKLAA